MTDTQNIILVPTDFSEVCQNAIDYAIGLITEVNSVLDKSDFNREPYKLALLHVINKDTRHYLKREHLEDDAVDKALETIAEEIRDNYDIEVLTIVKEGSIFEIIPQTTDLLKARTLLIGTHGKRGLQQHLLGSYALKVVTRSPRPAVVVQKGTSYNGLKKIVFPINNFTESRQMVRNAVNASKMFGATIYLVRQTQHEDEFEYKMAVITKQITDSLKSNDIPFEIVATDKRGDYTKHLIEYAHEIDADLIMLMTDSDPTLPDFNIVA